MGADSDIEWTDATWPVTDGCSDESPGCLNCYAKRFVHRGLHARTRGLTVMGARGPKWTGEVRPVPPEVLAWPLSWKKAKRIFVNSQSDLFHEDVPDEHIAAVFGVMAACPQHTFQILTKRAERLPEWFAWLERDLRGRFKVPALIEHASVIVRGAGDVTAADRLCRIANESAGRDTWPLPNVWIGVSVEDQQRANERVPQLLKVPAAVRFLSCEPLIERVTLSDDALGECDCMVPAMEGAGMHAPRCRVFRPRIDWVVVGGESGPRARPMHPDWARSLRDQCAAADVPFLFKQWGEWAEIPFDHENPPGARPRERYLNAAGGHGFHGESVVRIRTAHKKDNGRELDGRTWDEFPAVRP